MSKTATKVAIRGKKPERKWINLAKAREYNVKWRQAHPEQFKEIIHNYYINNIGKKKAYERDYHSTPVGKFNVLKKAASQRNIPIEVTREQFCEWFLGQPPKCHYCDIPLFIGKGRYNNNTLTIDRKDNKRNYNLANMVFCCRRCNIIKGAWFTEQQMLEIADKYIKAGYKQVIKEEE